MNFDKTKLKMAYNCNKLFNTILCHFSIDKQKHTENHNIYIDILGFLFLFDDKGFLG